MSGSDEHVDNEREKKDEKNLVNFFNFMWDEYCGII